MEEKTLIFGHKSPDTDSICSSLVAEKFAKNNGWEVEAVRLGNLNKETQYVLDYLGIEAPRMIEKVEEGQSVILVDHNEFAQSVNGIEKTKIEAVTDHHRIANFETSEPLYYTAKPYGCTATILFEEYQEKYASYMKLEKKEAILMASAIISDTLLLKSPTTTNHDKKALEELAEIGGFDVNAYGLEMLKAGTDLDDLSAQELVKLDTKCVEKGEIKYVIAQVNTVSIKDVLKRQDELEQAILNEISINELDFFVFVITDILESNSEVMALGTKAKVVEKAFWKPLEENRMFLEGVVSRKKQLLPKIDQAI